MILVLPREEVRAIHIVQRVVLLIRGRVLLLGSQVVSVRPTLPERPDPVVHAVVSSLKRQPRALRRRLLNIGERLEEVAVAEVHVLQTPMPGQSPREAPVSIGPAPLVLQLLVGQRPNVRAIRLLESRLLRPLRVDFLPLLRSQSLSQSRLESIALKLVS